MKAAVFKGIGQPLAIETVPDPVPGTGEVIVRVRSCGICGSDLHMTEDPLYGPKPGAVLGHEFAGEIAAVGAGVARLAVGERVAVAPIRSCGACASCAAGRPAWCPEMRLQGGGYAEYVVAAERQCFTLPSAMATQDGALVEPLAVAVHAVTLADLEPGARVLVVGGGPIGLAVTFWARRLGAKAVGVVDLAPEREELARAVGATAFFAGGQDEIAPRLEGVLGGPPDVVFECVGRPGLIGQCVSYVRPRGTVVVLGLCTEPDPWVPFAAVRKEARVQFSAFFEQRDFEFALDALAAGAAEPRALVTATVPLATMPEAFEALRRRTRECKVLVDPQAV
jgi:(R,R)-butanediol dehydrogenase/meso-butanediol dehydrogenase/diacetyl reductase